MKKLLFLFSIAALALSGSVIPSHAEGDASGKGTKVVFIAGKKSHGYGAHEFNAGCLLMQQYFKQAYPEIETDVALSGWPKDPETFFKDADSIVIFCDGGGGHPVIPHLEEVDKLMKQGVGLTCLHYAVEVPLGLPGKYFLQWLGGYFEVNWSVNPHWEANFTEIPEHEITKGVKPFKINDEWYYHMRFRGDMDGITPILSATAPESTLSRPDGPHSGNPDVRKAVAAGEKQHVAWAYEREDGGRAFGFTGLHFHWNYENDDFRKVVLNGIAWTAKLPIPENGIETETPSQELLEKNQDFPKPEKKG